MTDFAIQHAAAREFLEQLPWPEFVEVLDIGGGDGFAAAEFERRGKRCRVVDLEQPVAGIKWIQQDAHRLDGLDAATVDAVWSHHSLEHMTAPLVALTEWARVLRHDGWLFLTIPDCTQAVSTGHIHSFTWPMLAYNLAVAGFDLRAATCGQVRSHMRLMARKRHPSGETNLRALSDRLPLPCARQILDTGRIQHWHPNEKQ
jgi:SAM-dependent methyltransferase